MALVAFYCVADDGYFLGAVGLINSLRLTGHDEPVFVLDRGLTDRQRELVAGEATVVEGPPGVAGQLLKTIAPLRHPAETTVLIDTDMIVVRPLGELIEGARPDRVVAFRNHADRHVAEWGELLGLGAIERLPYLSSGFVAMGRDAADEVLGRMDECQAEVDFERTLWRRNDPGYAFRYADQDVFNAVVAARVGADRVTALDAGLCPGTPFAGLGVADAEEVRVVSDDGVEPFVLHHALSPKPWQEPAYDGVYSQLLRRLLIGPGVAIRVEAADVPLWLRGGPLAHFERQRIKAREQIRWRVGRSAAPGG
jgi:hypothetical protein